MKADEKEIVDEVLKIEELLNAPYIQNTIKELPPELNEIFNQYEKVIYDILLVGLTYLRGFNAISNDELKMEEGGEELVEQWVKSVERNRTGQIIGNLFANGFVATLEDFLKDIDEYVKQILQKAKDDRQALSAFKADYENIENEINKTKENKYLLISYLKPSAKKEMRWLKILKELYKMNLDPSVDEVMRDMISNRHIACHNPTQRQNMEVKPEQLQLWHLGTLYLILLISLAVHERIK
jgi:hypothetical protein